MSQLVMPSKGVVRVISAHLDMYGGADLPGTSAYHYMAHSSPSQDNPTRPNTGRRSNYGTFTTAATATDAICSAVSGYWMVCGVGHMHTFARCFPSRNC